MTMHQYILTLTCPDRPGIVLALAQSIVDSHGNILENEQFSDPVSGSFCVRIEFESPDTDEDVIQARIAAALKDFDPTITLRPAARRQKVLILVSKFDHCLVDILYRWETGELPIEIPLVVSNHKDTRPIVERLGIPFVWVPVGREAEGPTSKAAAEARMHELIAEYDIDLVVLARYMQVLSDDACERLAGRVINIHHSFLPGFKGAKPYHQAFDRGVKLIGATAHYVTADLDEGPIIEQDVVRVTHAQSADALVALGRDVERRVLSRALRLHAEDRVIRSGSRTIVFA
jgi:formyltetrahydrofolate deformylase